MTCGSSATLSTKDGRLGRLIGPWPVGLRMLIFPLGDNWRATFTLERSALADYRDDVLPIVLRLRNEFDIIDL